MKKRNLLLVVFAVALLALCGCSEKEVDNKKDVSVDEPTKVALTNMDDVVYLKYTDNTTTVTLTKTDGTWYLENDTETWLNQERIYSIEDAAAKLIALDVVDDAGALKDYGLETPAYTVGVKDAEGNEIIIYIGDASSDTNYYATIGDKKEVYVINAKLVAALEFNTNLLMDTFEDEVYQEDEIYQEEELYEEEIVEEPTEEVIEENTSSETEE